MPHDAVDPVGFCFEAEGVRIGVVTDLGYVPESIKYHLRRTDLLLLEANHDLDMLKVGPYPWTRQAAGDEPGRPSFEPEDVRIPGARPGFLDRHPGAGPFERAEQPPGDRAAGGQPGAGRAQAWRRSSSSPRSARRRKCFNFDSTMIPRYTRPDMGRIWSDQNRFQQWLEVELAASEALAELGVVPQEAARLLRAHAGFEVGPHSRNREGSEARCHRLHHRRGRNHGPRGARRSLALAALRADFQRRGGYRPGAAAPAGRRHDSGRIWRRCARSSSAARWSSATPCRSAARTAFMPSRSSSG